MGITDDGIDLDHEDLKNNIWKNSKEVPNNRIDDDNNGYIDDVYGWDFISNDNDPRPDRSSYGVADHGTHVAGIVAGDVNNGVGIVGAAPRVKLMPLKFYGSGAWTSAIVARAYAYAADNGAKIISTSYNVDSFVGDPVYEAALDYAYDKGVLIFNSAGNNGMKDPARGKLDQFLLVCSTEIKPEAADKKSSFSNYGARIDICSPGSDILSTIPDDGYEEMSGTSMATPNAAGVAALIWSIFPRWTREQVAAQLLGTTEIIESKNTAYSGMLGTGRTSSLRAALDRARLPEIKSATTLENTIEGRRGVAGINVIFKGFSIKTLLRTPRIMFFRKLMAKKFLQSSFNYGRAIDWVPM